MPKRKHEEKEERWKRKLKKYEDKLNHKRRNRIILYSSDEENDVIPEEHLQSEEIPFEEMCNKAVSNHTDIISAVPVIEEPVSIPTEDITIIDQNMVPGPSCSENIDLDPDILEALGDYEIEKDEWSENVHPEIAQRFTQILISGLKKEQRQELLKKYLVPKNSPLAKAPILNSEIGAMLSDTCKNRDKRFLDKQEQIGRALSALEMAMTALTKKDFTVPDIIRILNDTGKLLADSHHKETVSRRFLIIPFVDKSLIDSFNGRKRDNFLFGDKLDDLVRTSRGIKKTSQQIIAPAATSSVSTENWKSPSDRGLQQRSGQLYTRPGTGGQRTAFSARGRAALLPMHPPHQRRWTQPLSQPPPPPPARQIAPEQPQAFCRPPPRPHQRRQH